MIIHKNTHAPLRLPRLLIKPKLLAYRVGFTESCRYDIGRDQGDINKLFGVGYFPSHHENSVRVGWNYDLVSGRINLFAYWYVGGKRDWQYLRSVDIGIMYYFKMYIDDDIHRLDIAGRNYRVDVHSTPICYLLRPYFGGNRTAPHDIVIDIKKV